MESVGDGGVRLVSWLTARDFIGNFFDKLAFRKLNFNRDAQNLLALDEFRQQSSGKKYALNIKKIFTNKSEVFSQQANIQEDRQFFCSELVAKAYKVLGVMKDL
jgi:hypothetical protein